MIKITKQKSEMREGNPVKTLTVEIDLDDLKNLSQTLTLEQLKVKIGEKFTDTLRLYIKCIP